MSISNEFLTNNSINRGLTNNGTVYVFTGDGGYEKTNDETELKNLLDAGGVAISKQLHDNQSYGQSTPEPASDISTDGVVLSKNEVYKLLPWLQKYGGADADKLVEAYINGYIESSGDTDMAMAELRFGEGKDAYARVFPNIQDADTGALKMTETEYISGLESTLTALTEYSLGGYASAKGKEVWATLVENNVSAEIYRTRLGTAYDLINEVDEELKQSIINQYNEYFSAETGTTVSMDTETILALAIDPNINNDILSGRLNASELGAIYTGTIGEAIDLSTIERYIGAGVQTSQAEKLFTQASTNARLYGRLSRKYGRNTDLGKVSAMLEESLFGNELVAGEIKAIASQSLSESSVVTGAAKSQTGQVIGLTEE